MFLNQYNTVDMFIFQFHMYFRAVIILEKQNSDNFALGFHTSRISSRQIPTMFYSFIKNGILKTIKTADLCYELPNRKNYSNT